MVTEKFSEIHCRIECSVQSTIKQPYGMIAIVKGKTERSLCNGCFIHDNRRLEKRKRRRNVAEMTLSEIMNYAVNMGTTVVLLLVFVYFSIQRSRRDEEQIGRASCRDRVSASV